MKALALWACGLAMTAASPAAAVRTFAPRAPAAPATAAAGAAVPRAAGAAPLPAVPGATSRLPRAPAPEGGLRLPPSVIPFTAAGAVPAASASPLLFPGDDSPRRAARGRARTAAGAAGPRKAGDGLPEEISESLHSFQGRENRLGRHFKAWRAAFPLREPGGMEAAGIPGFGAGQVKPPVVRDSRSLLRESRAQSAQEGGLTGGLAPLSRFRSFAPEPPVPLVLRRRDADLSVSIRRLRAFEAWLSALRGRARAVPPALRDLLLGERLPAALPR